jgi:predicted ATPase
MVQQVAADATLDAWAVLDALGTLVDWSLVAMSDDSSESPRYRLLDTPRVFALERLVAVGREGGGACAPCRRRARPLQSRA